MRPWIPLAIATSLLASPAFADDRPLPPLVARTVKESATMCSAVGGKPNTEKAVTRQDLNGDGIEDFLFNVGAIQCDGAASIYGDREKTVTIFVGDGAGGATEAFSHPVFGVKVEGTGKSAKVWLTVMARECGKRPAKDFASETFCERPLDWNEKTKGKFAWARVSEARMEP